MIRKAGSIALMLLLPACEGPPPAVESAAPPAAEAQRTNRIDIPPTVRRNLAITFTKVEVRNVEQTIRAPGRFELPPRASREYRTMLAGRVELHVSQYDEVETGQPLYSLDSPQWREFQHRLSELDALLHQLRGATATIAPLMEAHERHHHELSKAVDIWAERVRQLEENRSAGVITATEFAQARGTLASTRAELAEVMEKEAQLEARRIEIEAQLAGARTRFELLVRNASSLLDLPVDAVTAADASGDPKWQNIDVFVVRAADPGVVQSLPLTNGAWAAQTSVVLTTVQPEKLRFRALALQSDLPRIGNGAVARIAPPEAPLQRLDDTVAAALTIGLEAHPDERTIALIATPQERRAWMRDGVSAFLEIVTVASGQALAIPRSAIVKDGIVHVFFRRDPSDPNAAIRVEADMGADDGRWVVIHSGVALGDEVVLDGAYELKLASSGGADQKGGHIHADGTFHADH